MTAPSEQIIELQGGKWKTRVLCAGEGDPVVFLHGAGGLHWDPFLDGLAEHFRIFAPEHLGAGDSQGIEHLYDILDLVLYYAELFDAMGLSAFSLIGHSFGGMVAAEIAAINPERVHKLALLAPLGLWQDEHPVPDISTIAPDQLPGMLFADPDGPAASMAAMPDPRDPEALFQAAMAMASILQFIWPLPDKGLSRRLYRVKAETLVIWGREDHLVDPVYGEAFASAIGNAQLELVDHAGHLPHIEQGGRVLPLVTGFLA